ncbi:hypothetical protein [Sphingobium sp. WCS2017Hpa-17]|uniref:hypothetical protein n=1 Tax=Sphingobium sp. WCS2017Hpa-17 TaxID=3073638 RepID=UPI00288A233B|nr:hypothetical protein [Sphingobium sp. WCS2017Hpa-17]
MIREQTPNSFQGWLALGVFAQTTMLFGLMAIHKDLLDSQGFMTLASAVIVTAWVGAIIGAAFQAGKTAGEQAAVVSKAMDIAATAQAQSAPQEPRQ